ncbi:MAG: hypothetical protein ACP5RX_02345, partial [Minisyncoccia bacterium]
MQRDEAVKAVTNENNYSRNSLQNGKECNIFKQEFNKQSATSRNSLQNGKECNMDDLPDDSVHLCRNSLQSGKECNF